jgi:hypothetical protein
MHDVQTDSRLGEPLTSARMRWMLGFQRRFVRRWEWLMLMPKEGCFPHTSHTAAMGFDLSALPLALSDFATSPSGADERSGQQ